MMPTCRMTGRLFANVIVALTKQILGILFQQQQQHVLLVYWTFYRSAGLGHSVNTAAIKVVCTGNKVKRET